MKKVMNGEMLAALLTGLLLAGLAAFLACDSSSSTVSLIGDDETPDDDDDDDNACGNTKVCVGCCSGNICLQGNQSYACGTGGNACLSCPNTASCLGGQCIPGVDDDDNDNDNDDNDNDNDTLPRLTAAGEP